MTLTFMSDAPLLTLCSDNCAPTLPYRILDQFRERYFGLLKDQLRLSDDADANMIYSYITHGCIGVVTWWIVDGMRIPPRDVIVRIKELCLKAAAR